MVLILLQRWLRNDVHVDIDADIPKYTVNILFKYEQYYSAILIIINNHTECTWYDTNT